MCAANKVAIKEKIKHAVTTYRSKDIHYLTDIVTFYASLHILDHPGSKAPVTASKFNRDAMQTSPVLDDKEFSVLCDSLIHNPDTRFDNCRLLIYQLFLSRLKITPQSTLTLHPFKKPEALALRRLLTGYASECTFKTSGDYCIHAECILKHLPAWSTSAMVQYDSPYPLIARAFPENSNSMVRPILDKPAIQKLDHLLWSLSAPEDPLSLVLLLTFISEISGLAALCPLINTELFHRPDTTQPILFFLKSPDGNTRTGIRENGALCYFPDGTSPVLAALQWLWRCRECEWSDLKNVTEVIFNTGDVSEKNPLFKFFA